MNPDSVLLGLIVELRAQVLGLEQKVAELEAAAEEEPEAVKTDK